MANLHGLTNFVADSYSLIDGQNVENLDDRYLRVGDGGAKGEKGESGVDGTSGDKREQGIQGGTGVKGQKGSKGDMLQEVL